VQCIYMHGGLTTTIINVVTVTPKVVRRRLPPAPPPAPAPAPAPAPSPSYNYQSTVKTFTISKKLNVFHFAFDPNVGRPYMVAMDTSNIMYVFEIDY